MISIEDRRWVLLALSLTNPTAFNNEYTNSMTDLKQAVPIPPVGSQPGQIVEMILKVEYGADYVAA